MKLDTILLAVAILAVIALVVLMTGCATSYQHPPVTPDVDAAIARMFQ